MTKKNYNRSFRKSYINSNVASRKIGIKKTKENYQQYQSNQKNIMKKGDKEKKMKTGKEDGQKKKNDFITNSWIQILMT